MSGRPGISNLIGMRGRRKGGHAISHGPSFSPESLEASVVAFRESLAARAYSQGSIGAHHWALRQFVAWANSNDLISSAAFTRISIESYKLYLHHYRSPRTKEPLVTNTQLARLGCVRRFFAWLCRSGIIPANPAADLDLPRKQARHLLNPSPPMKSSVCLPSPNPQIPLACATARCSNFSTPQESGALK